MITDRPATQRVITKISTIAAAKPPDQRPSVSFAKFLALENPPWKPLYLLKPSPQSKRAAASTPQSPQAPCTAKASMGSSTLHIFNTVDATTKTKPPMIPMTTAEPLSTLPQPAVIETRPPRIPLHMAEMSYLRVMPKRTISTTRPAVEAVSVVFIATTAAIWPVSVDDIPSVEPQLKPYQPNQRMKVPSTINGKLCGSKFSLVSLSNRPFLGPLIMAPTRAPTPPVMWTMPLPAKSLKPTSLRCLSLPAVSHPLDDHIHATTIG
mmetsp:Transcript_76566/g.144248  ORF Transcript_76566/g.144248 Transcript_76566/m.144248 type:complete len:265 (+) Transcript_76566:411-1205(+)